MILFRYRVYWLTCVLAFLAVAASATTIILPTDEQLIKKSSVIVAGTVLQSTPVDRGNAIWMESTLHLDRVFKGDATGEIIIGELGGEIGDRMTKVFGAPQYIPGEHVLAFLTPTPRNNYQTMDLYVGKFTEQRTLNGNRIWQRDDITADVSLLDSEFRPIRAKNVQRDATAFEKYISDRVAGEKGANNYGVENPLLERDIAPARSGLPITSNFTLISEPSIYRWFAFDHGTTARWYSYGTQPGYSGGGINEIQTAMSAWTGYTSALIRYSYAGVGSGSPGTENQPNGINEVKFSDPLQEIAGSYNPSTGGVVGQGGFNGVSSGGNWTSTFTADSSHTQGTFHAYEITEAFIVIQDNVSPATGISSNVLAEICAHEFGHTLGLGHSSDPTALMYPTVTGIGPTLRADDQLAARWLYPNGSAAPPPTPTVPAAPTNLTCSASGSNINLQWHDNASNETGQWIYLAVGSGSFSKIGDAGAGATSATITGAAAGTYRVYLTAYNSAGESSPSNTLTVTVAGTTPTPAPIAAFSVSPSSGVAGSTTFAFTDQSTGSITSRVWNFGDGTTSSEVNPTHVYMSAATFTIILTISGSGGQSQAVRTVSVTSSPVPVVPNVSAAFDFSPSSPNVKDLVSFIDSSSGSPTAWSWSFGDGTTSNARNPTHSFVAPGTYYITLIASNAISSSAATHPITVNPLAPYRSLVSVTAQTNGVGGSVWRTELTLFNAGNEVATGQFVFIPGAGGSVQTRSLYIAPRQTLMFSNALLDIFGMSSGAGAIAVEASSAASTPAIKLTSRTYTTGSSGTYGQGVPNINAADLQQTLFLTGLESDADYRTNVGLVNRSDTPLSVLLTLYNGNGGTVGTAIVVVAANSFQQAALSSYFPAVANVAYNALSMRSDAAAPNAISVYASVIDNRTQDPVYLQASGAPSGSRATIPAVGRAPGANGTFWRSDVRLFNPTATTMSLTLRYLAAGADNRNAATIPIAILPGQTAALADVASHFGISSGSGALEMIWNGETGPIVASRTYTTADGGGTYGQSIDPVQTFGYDAYVPGLRSDSSFRSNVGFVNSGDSTIGITATLLASSGQAIGSAFVQLAPKSQIQYSLGALFPSLNVGSLGTVTLQTHTDSGPMMFVYGSMIDNSSGDPVFFAGE